MHRLLAALANVVVTPFSDPELLMKAERTGLRMKIRMMLAAAAVALTAGSAHASELGWQSSGSFNVRVTIAPLGGALAASQAGAQGLWSIGAGNRGLMVSTPNDVIAGQPGELALFATQTSALTIQSLSPGLSVSRAGSTWDRGLSRQAFTLNVNDASSAATQPGLVVISTL